MRAMRSDKSMKRIVCALLSVLLLFTACARTEDEGETTEPVYEPTSAVMPAGMITVPYTSLDTVNPFLCDSLLNSSLISLVFRSLYRLDGGFTAVRDMAAEENVSASGVKVTIDDDLVFSDARPVSAKDVVYSFEAAADSPLWQESLAEIKSCRADGDYTVTFETNTSDVNVLNLLTFPIVEAGTAEGEDALPIGSGYYRFERDELRMSLLCNLRYPGALPEIGTVRLYDVTESSSLMHLLDTGIIDCFFSDLADGTAKRTYSSVSEIYLNNLVFLGLNHESYPLSMSDVRRAISLALDRRALVENAFVSHARPSCLPFNMSWSAVTDLQESADMSPDSDIRASDALLDEAGCGNSGDKIYLTLICRDENSFMKNTAALIVDELSLVNIDAELKLMSENEFNAALRDGEYDMYLSEIKLTKNMDLSPFFSAGGEARHGIVTDSIASDDAYYRYRTGEADIGEFLTAFAEDMPFIPLLYRNGQFCYSRNLSGISEATENALFSSIAGWQLN